MTDGDREFRHHHLGQQQSSSLGYDPRDAFDVPQVNLQPLVGIVVLEGRGQRKQILYQKVKYYNKRTKTEQKVYKESSLYLNSLNHLHLIHEC